MLPLWAILLRRVPFHSERGFLQSELLGLAILFLVGVTWTCVAAANTEVTTAVFTDVTQLDPWLYVLPGYLDHFALGMGLAVASVVTANRPVQPRPVRIIDRAPWLPWLAAGLAFFMLANVPKWIPDDWAEAGLFGATHVLQGVFAFALLLPAVFGDPSRGLVRRSLANRALLWIGLVSYGVYLWHEVVNFKLVEWGALDALGSAGYIALALGVTLLIAAASFYGVERYALRLGRRLSHRRRSPGRRHADARLASSRATGPRRSVNPARYCRSPNVMTQKSGARFHFFRLRGRAPMSTRAASRLIPACVVVAVYLVLQLAYGVSLIDVSPYVATNSGSSSSQAGWPTVP